MYKPYTNVFDKNSLPVKIILWETYFPVKQKEKEKVMPELHAQKGVRMGETEALSHGSWVSTRLESDKVENKILRF